ncbi:uncharacterized protein N7518_002925 [Penicillium psychrosexuale]|uniref:uncharacterized protein n=1 Tax=Penicillium psychrosexuale TaxID=1002107 RepID=UPI0025451E30|nr:uncharacterized protein N7518_002925 [Penicillium psychrosexuale]KAJ5800857.1 hypothetical protein N7518_002925 [Penicillium psychrosexuale]
MRRLRGIKRAFAGSSILQTILPLKLNLRQKVFDLIFKAHHNELEQVSTMVQDFLDGRLTRDDSRRETQKLPTLAVGDLDTKKVDILNLNATQEDEELAYILSIPTSTKLKSVLTKVDAARSKSPLNEASIRWTINLLIIYAHDIATFRHPRCIDFNRDGDIYWRSLMF